MLLLQIFMIGKDLVILPKGIARAKAGLAHFGKSMLKRAEVIAVRQKCLKNLCVILAIF